MFELTISKQAILTPLLAVAGAVDKKPMSAILGHVLLKFENQQLWMTATDLDIEMTACVPCSSTEPSGIITVPARKFVDIIRSLDDDAIPVLRFQDKVLTIKVGRSQFKLTTLPGDLYPCTQEAIEATPLIIKRLDLINLLQSTSFAMSLQDVRVYLNGLLLEIDAQSITAVATDGHRMAVCRIAPPDITLNSRVLIPRKGVQEMLRLLQHLTEEDLQLSIGEHHIKIMATNYAFSSKLIEARFPPYNKAIPKNNDKFVKVDRDYLKRALSRIIILSNEKSRAVLLHIQPNQLTLITHNQEQEEAIETLAVETIGEDLKIGINANYLLDVLNHLEEGLLNISFASTDSSVLVEATQPYHYQYIIMPMKL